MPTQEGEAQERPQPLGPTHSRRGKRYLLALLYVTDASVNIGSTGRVGGGSEGDVGVTRHHSAMEGQQLDEIGSRVELSLKASGLPNMDYFR